jgi:hypothetical protein
MSGNEIREKALAGAGFPATPAVLYSIGLQTLVWRGFTGDRRVRRWSRALGAAGFFKARRF